MISTLEARDSFPIRSVTTFHEIPRDLATFFAHPGRPVFVSDPMRRDTTVCRYNIGTYTHIIRGGSIFVLLEIAETVGVDKALYTGRIHIIDARAVLPETKKAKTAIAARCNEFTVKNE